MTTEITNKTGEAQIRELQDNWAYATRFGKDDEVLANQASSALIFDVLSQLKHEGTDAYRRSWALWQPTFEIPSLFEIHEPDITAITPPGSLLAKRLRFCNRQMKGTQQN